MAPETFSLGEQVSVENVFLQRMEVANEAKQSSSLSVDNVEPLTRGLRGRWNLSKYFQS